MTTIVAIGVYRVKECTSLDSFVLGFYIWCIIGHV